MGARIPSTTPWSLDHFGLPLLRVKRSPIANSLTQAQSFCYPPRFPPRCDILFADYFGDLPGRDGCFCPVGHFRSLAYRVEGFPGFARPSRYRSSASCHQGVVPNRARLPEFGTNMLRQTEFEQFRFTAPRMNGANNFVAGRFETAIRYPQHHWFLLTPLSLVFIRLPFLSPHVSDRRA